MCVEGLVLVLFELYTALSERHRKVLNSFVQRKEYGTQRAALERALELLEALDGVNVGELLEAQKARQGLLVLFNFVLVNCELIEGLVRVALGESTMEALFEEIRQYTLAEFKTAQKVVAMKRVNSFSDMAESLTFYHKHLNIIGEVHVNEERHQVFARLNTFKVMPEVPLEILNTLLEASGYTFDLRLEEESHPIFIVTWVPPDTYSAVKEQREKYLKSRREDLIVRLR